MDRSFRFQPGKQFVKTALAGHSVMALSAAALLYLLSVTGVFSIFYPDYERWEQPDAPEVRSFDPDHVDAAVREVFAREATAPDYVFVNLPTDDMPRILIEAGNSAATVAADGTVGPPASHEWMHFLVALHYALTMPTVLGMTIVGIAGVLLAAVLISGLLSHPNIFRDAFSFRMNRSRRLQQVDLHNRLGVWTFPFQLMIALTGAFVGLSQVFIFLLATLFYEGDTELATASMFNPEPVASEISAPLPDVAATLRSFERDFPDLKPMSLTIHAPGSTTQMVEVGALVPNRLVWGEYYVYDNEGNYLEHAGWSDGDAGTQLYASTFRLHFGNYAGLPMKFAYVLLGLAMCFAVVSGINIWFLRRRREGRDVPRLERLWVGTIWGIPTAILLSAISWLTLQWSPVAVFWLATLAALLISAGAADKQALSRALRTLLATVSLLLVGTHVALFGADSFNAAAALVNSLWLGLAAVLIFVLWLESRRSVAQSEGAEVGLSAQAGESGAR